MPAYFDLPLNLPHAFRIAQRIGRIVENRAEGNGAYAALKETAAQLEKLLEPFHDDLSADTINPVETAKTVEATVEAAARIGRDLAQSLADLPITDDRLGQCVRNLFECLSKGREGAALGLAAGENPASLQRP